MKLKSKVAKVILIIILVLIIIASLNFMIFAIIISAVYFRTSQYKFLVNFMIERIKTVINRKERPTNE